jgi:phosphohistidine phosphatase
MHLILWRHAEAHDSSPDMARTLTAKGNKQAQKIAAWLKPRLPADTLVLASPAARTQQTALALTTDFDTLDILAPGASPQTLLAACNWPHAEKTIVVVGHQPTLGMAAALALTGRADYWSIKKGAIWWLTYRTRNNGEQAVLRTVLSPEMLD